VDVENWSAYILVLELDRVVNIEIRRRRLKLQPGIYFYVGSARKRIIQRITRHLSKSKKKWWHIDYLTTHNASKILGFILVKSSNGDCESELASRLNMVLEAIPRFGQSDKPRDISHLFKCSSDYTDCTSLVFNIVEESSCVEDVVYIENQVG